MYTLNINMDKNDKYIVHENARLKVTNTMLNSSNL